MATVVRLGIDSLKVAEHGDTQVPRHIVGLESDAIVPGALHVPSGVLTLSVGIESRISCKDYTESGIHV